MPPRRAGLELQAASRGDAVEDEEAGLLGGQGSGGAFSDGDSDDDSGASDGESDAGGGEACGATPPPYDSAGLVSRLLFLWLSPLLALGATRQLDAADLPALPAEDEPRVVSAAFRAQWRRRKGQRHRLARSLIAVETPQLLRGGAAKLLHDTVMFASPAALHALLTLLSEPDAPPPGWAAALPPARRGGFYVAVLACTAVTQTLCIAQYFDYGFRTGFRARGAVVSAIFRKTLRLAPAARSRYQSGEIMTMVAADAKRLADAAPYLQMIWSGPYQIILSVAMLWSTLGPAFWAGIGVIFALLPLSGLLSAFLVKLQGRLMTAKDARVSRTSEALGAIKLLKACGWEQGFGARVTQARADELRVLRSAVAFEMGFGVLWEAIPLLVAMVAFLAFSARGGVLTAARVFTSLALFDVIRFPLLVLPEIVTQIANTAVSLKRLQAFLEAEELPRPHHRRKAAAAPASDASSPAVEAAAADLAWEAGGAAVLTDVTLRVAPGELVCVLGAVGSGKSTLVSALLGELPPARGAARLRRGARVSYCAQTPFVVAGTVRDNVLFGAPYDAASYDQALRCACLGPDLAALPAGDATRVGENGVTLSGGQRQRLALARAAYRADADVVVLDDPLSALDASVGRAVFDALLGPRGVLAARGAARVLVTHGAQDLPEAHRLVLLRGGKVEMEADYATMAAGGAASPLAELMQLYGEDVSAAHHAESAPGDAAPAPDAAANGEAATAAPAGKVVVTTHAAPADDDKEKDAASQGGVGAAESRQEGRVDARVYLYYLRAAGYTQSAGVLALFAAWTSMLALSKLWLARWAASGGLFSPRWAGGYGAIGVAALLVLLARQALRTHSQVRGGRRLHEALLGGVLRARLSFFTATPTGRVLNRFAGDAAVADERLHDDACDALRQACAVAAAATVVGAVTPPLLLGLPPLALAFAAVQRRYAASARELQRLESVARSPIFSGVSEALAGAATIRAFGERRRFERQHREALAAQLRAYFACQSANRWLALRTEGIAAAVVVAAAAAALRSGSRVAPGLAGLSISYAMLVCNALSWLVRATSMVETEIVSVERMKEFAELQPEPPLVIPGSRPPPGWPSLGAVALEAVSLRYAPGLPRVLDAVTLRVAGGEKLGVVGRTGAGKSSLLLALLRLTDGELMEGRICIDGLDIASIGVGDLRSAVAVIPQEGTLFAGSLRFNLDPLGACGDAALTSALALVGLADRSLDADVAEEGGNWSAGQRQLLCLARAALRSSRVVLCDEATSSCDGATDALMQAAMRQCFAQATVLTVAHRIGTVTACDRVLVMHGGRVAELDAPAALAQRPGGIFAALLAESRRLETAPDEQAAME